MSSILHRGIGLLLVLRPSVISVGVLGVLALPLARYLTGMDNEQILKFGVAASVVAVALTASSRPAIAVGTVLVAGCYNQIVSQFGLTVNTADVALVVFAPALFASWKSAEVPRYARRAGFLLVVGSGIAALFAPDGGPAVWGAVRWMLGLNFCYAVAALVRSATPREFWTGASLIAALSSAVSALGLLQAAGIYAVVGTPYDSLRPDSTFGYYSNYANFIAIGTSVGLLSAHHWLGQRMFSRAVACGFAALVSAYALVGAASRGALLLVVVALAMRLVVAIRRPGAVLGLASSLAFVAYLLWLALPGVLVEAFAARFNSSQSGDARRFRLQDIGESIALQHPFGVGFGNFPNFLGSAGYGVDRIYAHCHSTYVQVALDAGWVGLVGFLVLCGGAALSTFRGADHTAAAGAILIGLLAQLANDYFFFETGSLLIALVLVGAALGGSVSTGTAPRHARRADVSAACSRSRRAVPRRPGVAARSSSSRRRE